jgi:hypothetical protein
MKRRWDPWAALTARQHIVYRRKALPRSTGGALYWPVGAYVGIFIDPRAARVERRCLLAHELVHDERQGGCHADWMPPAWLAVVMRDEATVDNLVADRLVPPDELAAFCARVSDLGMGVTPTDVASEFDVTEEVAKRALARLVGRPP